jgi:two-component system, cell cycle sensor histidine kinase and response regulator CckA
MALILIVDDDLHSRQLYASLLTPFRHEVIEASDGKEGLEQARARKPDLIISDILMPTMNGYEFVTSLRNIPALERIPVIFHSASFLDRETRTLGASCGVSLFIVKPCEPERALAIVHQALGVEVGIPTPPAQSIEKKEVIPVLIDAFFKKGKELDTVSLRLAALLELGLQLARPCELQPLLQKAGNAAREIVGANYAGVGILKKDGVQLDSLTLVGMDSATVEKIGKPTFDGRIFHFLMEEGKPQRAFSPDGEPAGMGLPFGHPPVHSFLGVPLQVGDHLYGWIYVAQKLSALEFDEEDERIMLALAAKIGLAYENSLNLRAIQEHAAMLAAEVEERKSAENKFRMLIETAPMGIVIADKRGRISEVNAQALQMFGYASEELLGQSVEMLLPERLRASHEGHRAGYAADPHARPMGVGMELFARRKDGTEFPVEISLGPLEAADELLISVIIVDITARKKMEKQLRLSQRMEAIGELAGGVAHDFNNLLAVILGCAEVVLDTLSPDHATTKKVEMVKQAASSAADLTRQLLAFSRQQMLQPRVLNLKEVIDKIQALLRRLIGENIEINVSLEPSLGCVKADPGQIEQVLLNLCVNARDAMPKGGRLTIQARNVQLDDSFRDQRLVVVPGPYVMLAVEDTGCGMNRETQARIFDPFFTTKEVGKGTGMGLATVYGIVKQSGGYIWVYSELGKGTVFKVYLPLVNQSAQPAWQKETDQANFRGTETILLAEDSDSLREMAKEYLESVGYSVIESASGKDAMERAKEFDGIIHLLLTDIVMPEMSGPDLAAEIAACRPGIKIVYTSGYTDDAIARQGILDPAVAFIQKPYRPKALARKIREVLDGDSTKVRNETHTDIHAPVHG